MPFGFVYFANILLTNAPFCVKPKQILQYLECPPPSLYQYMATQRKERCCCETMVPAKESRGTILERWYRSRVLCNQVALFLLSLCIKSSPFSEAISYTYISWCASRLPTTLFQCHLLSSGQHTCLRTSGISPCHLSFFHNIGSDIPTGSRNCNKMMFVSNKIPMPSTLQRPSSKTIDRRKHVTTMIHPTHEFSYYRSPYAFQNSLFIRIHQEWSYSISMSILSR